MSAVEWVYEIVPWIRLPFGWRVIRLKTRFKAKLGDQYKSPMLYRKTEVGTGFYREEYWPQTYLKQYRRSRGTEET
jgi:hypothetical protein